MPFKTAVDRHGEDWLRAHRLKRQGVHGSLEELAVMARSIRTKRGRYEYEPAEVNANAGVPQDIAGDPDEIVEARDAEQNVTDAADPDEIGGAGDPEDIDAAGAEDIPADAQHSNSDESERSPSPGPFIAPPHSRGDLPFQTVETAFEDSNVKILVKRVAHRQEKKFRLHDLMLDMVTEQKPTSRLGEVPLLWSLKDGVQSALTYMFDRLQNYYGANHNHQVFPVVLQRGLRAKRGLRCGHYSLDSPPAYIASQVSSKLQNYLKSHLDIALDKSFIIKTKAYMFTVQLLQYFAYTLVHFIWQGRGQVFRKRQKVLK